ncbi:Acg family FMN-binding oxidoreductase [Mycobacterium paraterrae]|uniref:NAD(P)H nitroreductase n=1 Tax=Mycobacterium paraterrae TaxID=577492 RepID=A0ABY3VUW7_9MYCO|nr:NAD(P)H nitroreductase [Mycobacterium paraterrae]UMB71844.1 NAD(P)H nitroreductase [Mycobacterium paraterrae]
MLDTESVNSTITEAVRSACRAPSLHNSQPWQWVLDRGQLQLFLDPSRVMTTDTSARQALISCGAALDHLRVAMAAAGWHTDVDRFPYPANKNHLASIGFTRSPYVAERDRRRARAVWERHTDRLPFSSVSDRESIEPILRAASASEAVHIDLLPESLRPQLIEASQTAESLRWYNTVYHDELCWWTAPFESSEGIPYSALGSASEAGRVAFDRTFPGHRGPKRREAIPEDNAAIVLLSTDGDGRAEALASGEALSSVLLECTMAGLATCPVTHVTELHVTRDLIKALLDREATPQVLVRVGVVPVGEKQPPPTPRRPLSEILRFENE